MSDFASRRVSEAELSIIEALWAAGGAMNAKDLQAALKEARGWERTTVRSLLTRLTEKGAVTADKQEDGTWYAPTFTRAEYRWDLTEALLDRLYGDDARELVADLCRHGVLDKQDLFGLSF